MTNSFDFGAYLAGGAGFRGVTSGTPMDITTLDTGLPYQLSDEQQRLIDEAKAGNDVIVDASVGSGKTSAIQVLCNELGKDNAILYLTYSRLLKEDAQRRVRNAKVQNYHGIVYPSLKRAGIHCGISESIATFNHNFKKLSNDFPTYDIIVIDEYQDITEEYAELLRNIKSKNPMMQVIMVGDMEQKIRSDTVLDVPAFVRSFCNDPVRITFTQSFRMGEYMGKQLSKAWNKPITGVNGTQEVIYMNPSEALSFLRQQEPGDLLCLGRRNGLMSDVLNVLEDENADVFNKNTVYASIRERDSNTRYGDDVAIFTTFDSSKGLERKISVIFDYDDFNWHMRLGFPNVDPIILRNTFLVAASRGKEKTIFVSREGEPRWPEKFIGYVPLESFRDVTIDEKPIYNRPFWASEAFDFKYVENIEECFELLEVTRLDNGKGEIIEVNRNDGLIDLSPAVGHYQEALYFNDFDALNEINKRGGEGPVVDEALRKLSGDPWLDSLALTAVDTQLMRYLHQVTSVIDQDVENKLIERLGTILPRDTQIQVPLELFGRAMRTRRNFTDVIFSGVADAIHNDCIYELKFTEELTHPMFLQLGLYLVMADIADGILWNTRTDERWLVTIPDEGRFMDAVVKTVTKQYYLAFE